MLSQMRSSKELRSTEASYIDFIGEHMRSGRSGGGTPLTITITGSKPIELRGLFLDLNIEFSGGQLLRFGPPKLLSPVETLARFSEGTSSGGIFLPLSLSLLS